MRNKYNEKQEKDLILEGKEWPLIPEGEYLVVFTHHETMRVFNTPKIFLHFRIVDMGPYYETVLYRAYRVKSLIGKTGKNGRFKLGRNQDLFRDICTIYEARKLRPDRVSLRDLKNIVITASVRTVKNDYRQREKPEMMQYSVISELKFVDAGVAA